MSTEYHINHERLTCRESRSISASMCKKVGKVVLILGGDTENLLEADFYHSSPANRLLTHVVILETLLGLVPTNPLALTGSNYLFQCTVKLVTLFRQTSPIPSLQLALTQWVTLETLQDISSLGASNIFRGHCNRPYNIYHNFGQVHT